MTRFGEWMERQSDSRWAVVFGIIASVVTILVLLAFVAVVNAVTS